MKVQDLIDQLTELDMPDAELRLAVQPSWPLRHSIDAVAFDESEQHVWLAAAEGHPWDESPYAPRSAWQGGEIVDDDDEDDER